MSLESEVFDPKEIRIIKDPQGRLVLSRGGQNKQISRIIRSFPLTSPDKFISLWDENGEIGLIGKLDDLDEVSRAAISEELEKAYFIPRITKILRIKELFGGITEFTVETDRGYRVFEVQSKNHIRHMGLSRVIITDVDGNKYEIPDVTTLDSRSRSLFGWVA